ncbi:Solute carrier family 22 member 6 [Bagarius yarrelli]|uniref:Solute carrier family 22 member 6 n=1 Tax=Bagarius yarrelli TaxID=175774 RepID=A0A556TX69_BAGYA|nr:Solute carrier family 22 member 6 [Bagarius yarrelli]
MAFADLLEQVGSMGRFQMVHVILLSVPIVMMASHNLLQNFVAAVPPHHCTAHANQSASTLGLTEALLLSVPLDGKGKLERCRRYVHPQWNILAKNSSEDLEKEEIEMEGCVDGWSYNKTDMSSTIITEWDLVCDLKSLKQMGQTIYMGGVLVGALIFGGLSDRWFLESARWLVLNKKPEEAVKNLKSVARFNGRQAEGDKINLEMLQESMKKEMSCSQVNHSAVDLVRTRTMRTVTVCLSAAWFSTSFSYYGLSMDLQKFGMDIYLIQVLFGAVDIPAKIIITVAMSIAGRRPSLCVSLVLAGVTILSNMLVPFEMQTLRTSLAVLGKGCLAASFNCIYLYSGELQNGMGWVSTMARLGAMVAPLILLISDTIVWIPGLIYGGAPILCGIFAYFLPETLNTPLPDTIQDAEERDFKNKNSEIKSEEVSLNDKNNIPLKEMP